MENYNDSLQGENEYLAYTTELIQKLLEAENEKLYSFKKKLTAANRDMWENSIHHIHDFTKLTEMNVHLQEVLNCTFDYSNVRQSVDRYLKLLESPYFGRIDFVENGSAVNERIYIGKSSVINPANQSFRVYDWRAPICSMFYRFEPGKSSFKTPGGEISGQITLKRQYKIVKSQLKFFFDCSMQISDEMLQVALSRNASPKMRTIIETIQKEQDIIIRDSESDLLIVQGVAGSGKTSIALHRVAFLLYEGLSAKLTTNNILILSPSDVFTNYISHVLPELGEENVIQVTLEALIRDCCKAELQNNTVLFKGRNEQVEACITGRDNTGNKTVASWVDFKGSAIFREIIDRYLLFYERRLVKFEDVYYNNRIIANRHELKSSFINDKSGMPMAKRLKRIKIRLHNDIAELKKARLKKLETIVQNGDGHEFEIKPFSRLLLMKDGKTFTECVNRFAALDVLSLYKGLFADKEQFYKLAKGLKLPDDIDNLVSTAQQEKTLYYEDWTAIAYMRLKVFGAAKQCEIRQVIIDEVQDYYPLQLAIIRELYSTARYTVVGDIAQVLERSGSHDIYEQIPAILGKRKTKKICLYRSYRSTFEINEFDKTIAPGPVNSISFPRYEEAPVTHSGGSDDELDLLMLSSLKKHQVEGYETMAVLCKTMKQAELLYHRLSQAINIKLVTGSEEEISTGCIIMPVYIAKGLEFDAVLVHGVDDTNYCTELDRRILYIACTRALHRLSLYYKGKQSRHLARYSLILEKEKNKL